MTCEPYRSNMFNKDEDGQEDQTNKPKTHTYIYTHIKKYIRNMKII